METVYIGTDTRFDAPLVTNDAESAYRIEVVAPDAADYATLIPFANFSPPDPSDGKVSLEAPGPDAPAWRLIIRDDDENRIVVDTASAHRRFVIDPAGLSISHKMRFRMYRWDWQLKPQWVELGPYERFPPYDERLPSPHELTVQCAPRQKLRFSTPRGAIMVAIEHLQIGSRRARFVSHSLPSKRHPNGVVVASDRICPMLYLSEDLGDTWSALKLQAPIRDTIAQHFLTSKGCHIVQSTHTRSTWTLDENGTLLDELSGNGQVWHGSWSVDESPSGAVIFSEYRETHEAIGGHLHVWRSEGGKDWRQVFSVRGRTSDSEMQIRHFHTCQADPFLAGRWYVSSGDRSMECAFWISDDDGKNWNRVSPDLSGIKSLRPQADWPKVLRTTAFEITPQHLIWTTDDKLNHGGAVLVEMNKSNWVVDVRGVLDQNLSRNFVPVGTGTALSISESKNFTGSASVFWIDDGAVAARAAIDNPSRRETPFLGAVSSRRAVDGMFFAAPDGVIAGHDSDGVLRWKTSTPRKAERLYGPDDAPFARVGETEIRWFPKSFRPRKNDLLAFFHSQRTGGTSFRSLLAKVYGAEFEYTRRTVPNYRHWSFLTEPELEPYKFYSGHAAFMEQAFKRRVLPVSIVRDPVQRVASLYRIVRTLDEPRAEFARKVDFETWCHETDRTQPHYLSNCQARFICGAGDFDYARQVISDRYLGVGIDIYRAAFIEHVAKALKWKNVALPHENAAPAMDFEITQSVRDFIISINAEDVKLYDFVKSAWELLGVQKA